MDLYQDNDVDMINFLISKSLIDKAQILECIEKVHSWQTVNQGEGNSENEADQACASAAVSDLKLNLAQNFPITIEELDAYLNFKANLNESNSSSEEDELK